MSSEMNMHEAAAKMQLYIAKNVGQLEKERKCKEISYRFEEAGRLYDLKLVRAKK